MRTYRCLILWFLVIANAGCASIGVRMGAYSETRKVYPATTVDAGVIAYTVSAPFRSPDDGDAQDGIVYMTSPVSVIDLPLAIALDTVLLPYDIYQLGKKKPRPRNAATKSLPPEFYPEQPPVSTQTTTPAE